MILPAVNTLLCSIPSGMADRIGLLISGYALAQQVGRKFEFVWETNPACNVRFGEVLQTTGMDIKILSSDPYPVDCPKGVNFDFDTEWWKSQWIASIKNPLVRATGYTPPSPWFYWGTKVQFSQKVLITAANWLRSNGMNRTTMESAIGVHIRSTDYDYKRPPVEHYVQEVERFLLKRDSMIILCTDNPEMRKEFMGLAGSWRKNVNWYRDDILPRHADGAVFEAACELCLLRSCGRLVLSGYSKFSRLACIRATNPNNWPAEVITHNNRI